MNESKETYRAEARRHRTRIDPASEDPEEAADRFFKSINPDPDKVVAAYWPTGREFDVGAILERLLKAGNVCALPVVQPDSLELRFARWSDDAEMVKGEFGILHPAVSDQTEWVEPDIVIVPMLAFDRRGHRLGQGGGYYDATLKMLRDKKDVLAVGVAYAQQAVLFNLPTDGHDQDMDWVITPQDAHYFRK